MAESDKELSQRFYEAFKARHIEIDSRLEGLRSKKSAEDLANLVADVARLRRELVDAVTRGYLPSYDQRQFELQVTALEQSLEQLRAATVPKSKFAFKRKTGSASVPSSRPANLSAITSTSAPTSAPATSAHNLVIASLSNTYYSLKQLAPSGSPDTPGRLPSDVTISDLSRCVVNLLPSESSGGENPVLGQPILSLSAVHIRDLEDCVLLLPMIRGSLLAHNMRRCLILVGCEQFRMHDSNSIDVFLSITSSPVIEHCSKIRFSVYRAKFAPRVGLNPGVPVDSQTDDVLPYQPQDFTHIRSTQSPNWSIIPRGSERDWTALSASSDGVEAALERAMAVLPLQD